MRLFLMAVKPSSIKEHESGSDRIAEAVSNLDVEIVVNVQGDEPLLIQSLWWN
jgi:CMP-2-keto-3-deoxyoctulosonic acid synthetase